MTKHYIILSSSYSSGRRIGLDYADDYESFLKDVKMIRSAYSGKRVSFSTHVIHTDSKLWISVTKKDPYFSDVTIADSTKSFITMLQDDRFLSGIDVARYILSKAPCTHTRLEKLTYMCYADYLCNTGDKLFFDKIYAFEHGPVVSSVYSQYSGISHEYPGKVIIPRDKEVYLEQELPIKSRILFSEDGSKKIRSIDATLMRYAQVPTEVIVQMTHKNGSPWSVTPKIPHAEILDEDIRKYHFIESF